MSTIKDGVTPILAAAQNGHLDVVEWLVTKANADANTPNKVLSRALGVCVIRVHIRIVLCVQQLIVCVVSVKAPPYFTSSPSLYL